jgi:hypothetical protein
MKLPILLKELMFMTGLAVAIMLVIPVQGFSQDKKTQDKDDEQTITLKIVKDDDGKMTVIDTTIITKGKGKPLQYEYEIRSMDKEMSSLEDQMRNLEKNMKRFDVEVMVGDEMKDIDSIVWVGDSIKKHIIIRGMGPHSMVRAPRRAMFFGDEDNLHRFNWTEDCEDVFMPRPPMSPQLEYLLQSIPMGRIKGFQIKDRKDGKRIIIDIDDDDPVMIMAPYRHPRQERGAKRIIIERDVMDVLPPPPPPPPAEQPKEPAPKPDKG